MTPQDLKNSILQLAIQGKLVEQRPEEGVAEVPAALQHGGKEARRHGEIEPPFDIPESWRWVRLGDVVFNHGQKKPSTDFSYIDIGSIDNKNQKLSPNETIVHPENASPRARKIVQQGDVLYATVRPYLHNICVIDRQFSHEPIASTGFAVMACTDCLLNGFLFYYLLSPGFDQYANSSENAKGVAYPAISDKRLYNAPFPLPPLAEQKRIVSKIEELLPLLARYEQAWTKLETFNTRFPSDLQKSLLQLAIQGKLVEQRPEEGTAETLYRQIQSEKHRLVQSGKIKKEKLLPEITEDEMPFDIPENWKWVRVAKIWSVLNGDRSKNYPPKSTLSQTGIPFISALNLDGRTVVADDRLLCLSDKQYERLGNGKLIKGDIVVCIRGSLGKHARYPFDKGAIASSLVIMRSHLDIPILDDFLMLYLDTPLFFSEIKKYDNGTAQPNLAAKSLEQFLFPLPPLAEQKRIVAKLEELLPQCDKLNQNI